MSACINRRETIAFLGCAAAWPIAARAQQRERMRRIGVLMSQPVNDEFAQIYLSSFAQGLQELGWAIGRNVRVAIQTAAISIGVELTPVGVRDAAEIERGISAFATGPNGGLIEVGPGSSVRQHRDLIIALAARHRLPAVYSAHDFAAAGGLISYAPDMISQYRQGATYVDRILKGEKPADLPVQAPTKFELVINLKTAKTLNLGVPPTLLAIADEVIE